MNYFQLKYMLNQSEYELNESMKFIKHIFNTKPFTMERYAYYKQFKNKLMNKTFTNRQECIELANKISPGLGMTNSVGTIENILKLQNEQM